MIRFPYHRALAPMMWVFVALASVELVVVHLVVMLLDWRIALVLSVISISTVIAVILLIRSFRRLPVVLSDNRLIMRAGTLKVITVDLANIAAVKRHFAGEDIKRPGTVNLALIAYPNLLIELREPIAGRRGPVTGIAHKLDDPDAFVAAMAR